jgi:dihydrolipoamide dehydrogenase
MGETQFDVVVIGAGPGGYVAAVRASRLGLKTAVVEKESLGGVCVNWGCIPTKALLRNAEVIDLLSQGRTYGFKTGHLETDYAAAQKRSRQVVKRQGIRVRELLKQSGVALFEGEGRLLGSTEIEVRPSGERIRTQNTILAVGARSREIPGAEFDGERVIDYRGALELTVPPASVVIVGGGPIGLEFATIWSRYGAEVSLLEMMPHILPLEDEEVAEEAERRLKQAGMKIHAHSRLEHVRPAGEGMEVAMATGEGLKTLQAEKVLVAAGFVPNVENLGLEAAGVTVAGGRVAVDGRMQTNVPHIYAIGDLNGLMGLAHVASAQGVIAAEAIAGMTPAPLEYVNIPRCTFTDPEIASVGLTEKQAKGSGLDVAVARSPLVPNGRAVAMNQNRGFVKLIADQQTRKLLGAHMIGPLVSELIAWPTAMMALGATVEQLARVIHPHPTLGESIMEAVHALSGRAIHI